MLKAQPSALLSSTHEQKTFSKSKKRIQRGFKKAFMKFITKVFCWWRRAISNKLTKNSASKVPLLLYYDPFLSTCRPSWYTMADMQICESFLFLYMKASAHEFCVLTLIGKGGRWRFWAKAKRRFSRKEEENGFLLCFLSRLLGINQQICTLLFIANNN